MSESYTFFSQDVSACNETEAWWNMINCIVNFVSASTNLATNLETNHINNVRGAARLIEKLPKPENVAETLLTGDLNDNIDQSKGKEAPDKHPEDMCLTDFPYFVDEIAEKSEDISSEKPPLEMNIAADALLSKESLQEPPTEAADSPPPPPPPRRNLQEKGDYNKLKSIPPSVVQPTQETDEGIEIHNDVLPEDAEEKTKKPSNKESTEDGNIKTPSDDSCFFQEYSDSDPSLTSSDIGSGAFDDQTIDESTVKRNIVMKQENLESKHDHLERSNKEETQRQIEEIRKILLAEGAISKKAQDTEIEKDEDETLNIRKSREIQTSATNRFKRTVRALITQSPELQKPIREDMRTKKQKERSLQDENTSRSVPKNINELKEQLDSIKTRTHTAGTQPKKESTPEKQFLDLTKRLKCCSNKNKTGKKGSTPEESMKAPRSSIINVKKEIIVVAEKKNQKVNSPKKQLKVTKRYDSIESVVKRMIQGQPKNVEKSPPESEVKRLSNEKQGVTKKQKASSNNQGKVDDTPKMNSRQGDRNRSPSKSSGGSKVPPQKELKTERPSEIPIIIINPKSKNVFKSEGPINPSEPGERPRTAIKTVKKLKIITEDKKKLKQTNQTSEEKKLLSENKTPTIKPKSRPKSATR